MACTHLSLSPQLSTLSPLLLITPHSAESDWRCPPSVGGWLVPASLASLGSWPADTRTGGEAASDWSEQPGRGLSLVNTWHGEQCRPEQDQRMTVNTHIRQAGHKHNGLKARDGRLAEFLYGFITPNISLKFYNIIGQSIYKYIQA